MGSNSFNLINSIFDFDNEDIILLNSEIFIMKFDKNDYDYIKDHINLLTSNESILFTNYFENKITITRDGFPTSKKLEVFGYNIIHKRSGFLTEQEILSLKISKLNIDILFQKGVRKVSDNNDEDDYETMIICDTPLAFNKLIQTSNLISLIGTAKYIKPIPKNNQIADFKLVLKKVDELYLEEQNYRTIIKCLNDYTNLDIIPDRSPFKIVAYLSIFELLLTNNPKNNLSNSITHQLGSKINLLINSFSNEFNFRNYFKCPNTDTLEFIIRQIYSFRSEIAHGNIPKTNDLNVIRKNEDNILKFLDDLLRIVLRISVENPQLIIDLSKC